MWQVQNSLFCFYLEKYFGREIALFLKIVYFEKLGISYPPLALLVMILNVIIIIS